MKNKNKEKATQAFKDTIKEHLELVSLRDPHFSQKYNNNDKASIDGCIDYIIEQVKQSGKIGFHHSEIFGMAVHYFDEGGIKAKKISNYNVIINKEVALTEEEKEQLREKARQEVFKEEKERMKKKKPKSIPFVKTDNNDLIQNNQSTLF